MIRPPGSLTEDEFLGRCIKCAACMRVCPTNVLQPALLEGGIEGLWTPILKNQLGYCEQNCVLCGQVCPTGAIRSISVQEKIGSQPAFDPKLENTLKALEALDEYDSGALSKLVRPVFDALRDDLKNSLSTTPLGPEALQPHVQPMLQEQRQHKVDQGA